MEEVGKMKIGTVTKADLGQDLDFQRNVVNLIKIWKRRLHRIDILNQLDNVKTSTIKVSHLNDKSDWIKSAVLDMSQNRKSKKKLAQPYDTE